MDVSESPIPFPGQRVIPVTGIVQVQQSSFNEAFTFRNQEALKKEDIKLPKRPPFIKRKLQSASTKLPIPVQKVMTPVESQKGYTDLTSDGKPLVVIDNDNQACEWDTTIKKLNDNNNNSPIGDIVAKNFAQNLEFQNANPT
jgi:hypothetical protein